MESVIFANCKVYMNAEVHSCQQYSIDHLARCLALPANQPHMLHQRYNGCDTMSPLFKIGKRIANNILVVNIGHILYLADVGQSNGVTNGRATAKMYMLLLYGVMINSCQSINQLRYNYASKSDKSASHFRQQLVPFNNTPSSTRWLYGSTILKQNQLFETLMALDGS